MRNSVYTNGHGGYMLAHGIHHGYIRVSFSRTMMHAARSGAPSGGTAGDTLLIVLKHLSSSDDSSTVCQRAARDLHRVSKQHQAEARATLRHLPMDRFYEGLLSACADDDDADDDFVPWELLAACPNVTSWTLHPRQLEEFQSYELEEEEAAAASRITRLEVKRLDGECDEQQAGLGKLLWACHNLEEVHITFDGLRSAPDPPKKPWLLLDPDSSSMDTVAAPALPLRSWTSSGVRHSLLAAWAAQQQLAPTLRKLELWDSGDGTDISWITALTGLQDLSLDTWSMWCSTPTFVSSMASLTRLKLTAGQGADNALCALTRLRDLVLVDGPLRRLPGGMTALKQLTALNLSHTSGLVLPSDLGAWLPRLERLIANGSTSAAVPATLSRLTHLDFSYSRAVALSLPSTLTSLRELVLDMAHSTAVATISSFTALEVLDVSDSRVLGPSLTVLQPLTRLRHLSMSGVEGCDPASYTVLGALQQLTRLDLARSDNSEAGCSVLAGTPPLPALKQLDISHRGAEQLAALAPWVSGLTALTMIRMASCVVGEGEALLYLPAQLREVHLAECGLRQLPSGLQRLSALEVLDVSDMRWSFGGSLQQLPGWLSQLGRLEALGLSHTSVTSEQEVLAHMPALRFVRLSRGYEQRVLAQAPHLHFGHSSRLDSW